MVAIPLGKLFLLTVKQVAKPVAKALKNGAKNSAVFKNYVVLPVAQGFNWMDVKVKTTLMGAHGGKVYKLNEKIAVEHGAELISEMFIYGLGAVIVLYEYTRSLEKDEKKEARILEEKNQFKRDIESLKSYTLEADFVVEQQKAEIRSLERRVGHLHDMVSKLSENG